jgi:hypothetical protein
MLSADSLSSQTAPARAMPPFLLVEEGRIVDDDGVVDDDDVPLTETA